MFDLWDVMRICLAAMIALCASNLVVDGAHLVIQEIRRDLAAL